jgi:hypothetical protein
MRPEHTFGREFEINPDIKKDRYPRLALLFCT